MGWHTTFKRLLARLSCETDRLASGGYLTCHYVLVMCLVIALGWSGNIWARQSLTSTPLHHFDLPCTTCHESRTIEGAPWSAESANAGKIYGDINRLCTTSSCHDLDPALNHPTGVIPRSVIPANMPLDSHSRITCLTCHDSADTTDYASYFDIGLERFLRRPSGVEFCAGCHMKMGGTMYEQSHWRFSAKAHLSSERTHGRLDEGFDRPTGEIDTESHLCLTCHDDKTVTIPQANESARQKHARRQRMTDHPIGMNYEHTALWKRPGRYRFPPRNQNRIRLFNGRVGCGSCHSLYSRTKKNLVVSDIQGALCRSCHNR
jgi:predicted CXXCH cytochrome family protein